MWTFVRDHGGPRHEAILRLGSAISISISDSVEGRAEGTVVAEAN